MIEWPLHARLAQQHRHQPRRGRIRLQHVPAPVGDDGGKRLVALQQEVDRALGVGHFWCGQFALAVLPRKAARFEQRVAVAQRQVERAGELQENVAAADGLAGLDKAQMLDRNPGLESKISLAHGAAVAPAAQEIANGIAVRGSMPCPRIHARIMRKRDAAVNAAFSSCLARNGADLLQIGSDFA